MENEQRKLIISKSAVETIVNLAAGEIESVYNLSKSANKNTRYTRVNINDGKVYINVFASFYFGYNLKDEVKNLQENIKSAVENMLGMPAAAVNVYVYDLVIGQEHQ